MALAVKFSEKSRPLIEALYEDDNCPDLDDKEGTYYVLELRTRPGRVNTFATKAYFIGAESFHMHATFKTPELEDNFAVIEDR